jgi:hypothetical protein
MSQFPLAPLGTPCRKISKLMYTSNLAASLIEFNSRSSRSIKYESAWIHDVRPGAPQLIHRLSAWAPPLLTQLMRKSAATCIFNRFFWRRLMTREGRVRRGAGDNPPLKANLCRTWLPSGLMESTRNGSEKISYKLKTKGRPGRHFSVFFPKDFFKDMKSLK